MFFIKKWQRQVEDVLHNLKLSRQEVRGLDKRLDSIYGRIEGIEKYIRTQKNILERLNVESNQTPLENESADTEEQ